MLFVNCLFVFAPDALKAKPLAMAPYGAIDDESIGIWTI
jgi:hypothetical protein